MDRLFSNLIRYLAFDLPKNMVFMFFPMVLTSIAIISLNKVLLGFILDLISSIAKSVFLSYLPFFICYRGEGVGCSI